MPEMNPQLPAAAPEEEMMETEVEEAEEAPVAEVTLCVYADGSFGVKQGEDKMPAKSMDEAISAAKQILGQAVEAAPGGEAQAMASAYGA